MLLFRMAKGFDRGARAYNTIEVRQLKAKTNYLKMYEKFMTEKMYLHLGDKYGDTSYAEETTAVDETSSEEETVSEAAFN